ncbi:MAG: DegT/DnrJ/EryC1/StrS family aminotransferase [Maricaulaceae bacterium]|jgi:dTDP-4-amino-4,6-dideoxygalactose transaminase
MPPRLPVMRPRLPDRAAISPYLDAIDANRWYSNNGPLLTEFEGRLARRYGPSERTVIGVANGTCAVALALLAQRPAPGGWCLLPSFTFAATVHAAVMAGLRPYFLDVEADSWALSPSAVRAMIEALRARGETVAACVPVTPFGAPLDPAPWAAIKAETGVAVAIDAAAAFSTVKLSSVPTAVSLHATKDLGVGEGGFVLWDDEDGVAWIRRLTNFSFDDERVAVAFAMNAKMSEYHAAVGCAALDQWETRSARLAHLARLCRAAVAPISGVSLQAGWGESWQSATWNVETIAPAPTLIDRLDREFNIEARRWWATPCHEMPIWADAPHVAARVTHRLATHVLGLPFHEDLDAPAAARIAEAVRTCIGDVRDSQAPPSAPRAKRAQGRA